MRGSVRLPFPDPMLSSDELRTMLQRPDLSDKVAQETLSSLYWLAERLIDDFFAHQATLKRIRTEQMQLIRQRLDESLPFQIEPLH